MQTKGLKRNTIDKYYTKDNISEDCIKKFNNFINVTNNDLIIEPSAGNGSFIRYIKEISINNKFYDIDPDHIEIIKKDFLEYEYKLDVDKYNKIHIIGNPPFGRQSSTAIKFIKKCCIFCDSVSFILPKSFKKESLKRVFPLNFHLIYEMDLPKNSFLVNNIDSDVPCVFQIWIKKNIKREEYKINYPIGFKIVKKEEIPDISFRRVGVNAGIISKDYKNKSIQSHYFIKFTNNKSGDNFDDIITKLQKIRFNFNNTVGPKSISKQELIVEFNKIIR